MRIVWQGGRRVFGTPEVIYPLVYLPPAYNQVRLVAKVGEGIGGCQKMLRKVKWIKLGKQIYWRLMKRVLEREGWRC